MADADGKLPSAELERRLGELVSRLEELLCGKKRVICAIDGRAASGKTTTAAALARRFAAAIVHADDFFLRPEQRTEARLAEPGGNFDRERFLEQVLRPVADAKERVSYRPFDCRTGTLADEITLPDEPLVIVEGSYSLHPELRPYYDLAVFVTTDPKTQLRRLAERDAAKLDAFREKWIPMEELYFSTFGVAGNCDIIIET